MQQMHSFSSTACHVQRPHTHFLISCQDSSGGRSVLTSYEVLLNVTELWERNPLESSHLPQKLKRRHNCVLLDLPKVEQVSEINSQLEMICIKSQDSWRHLQTISTTQTLIQPCCIQLELIII